MSERHDHVIDYVDAYFHDVLSADDDAYIEQHCERCRVCAVALEEAEQRFDALQAVPPTEASETLIQSSLQKVEAHDVKRARRLRRLRRGGLVGLAASVLLLGGLHLYYLNLKPSPYDLQVLGQTALLADSEASLRVRVLDHDRGLALQGVPVRIDLHDEAGGRTVHLASFTTDEQGTGQPRFRLPDWKHGEYRLRVTAEPGGRREEVAHTVKLRRSWKLMLSSDRPVYQPGQEIHVRALALRGHDLKPVAGQEAVFTIGDPKGNVIFKEKHATSKFGIAAVDCPLAHEILEGPYTIQCQLGDTASKLTVEVKKYVLPKFKVEVKPDRPYYQPGQRVRGTVSAAYFFGKPVAGGTVELELRGGAGAKLDEKAKVRTDEKGEASFDFAPLPAALLGKDKDVGEARLELHATVTDTARQKQSRKLSVIVTGQPLRIAVIPEAGSLVRDLPNTVYLFVSSPDGQPVKARVTVSGVAKELATSDLGVTSFEITPDAAEVKWTIRARDDKGHACSREVQMECGKMQDDFLIRTDRAVYTGGDTVQLVALGGGRQPVFVDLIKDGQTILTETIAMADGRGEYRFDLPPELFGTVQLCAYRFGARGLDIRRSRVLYVRPANQVAIRATPDRPVYRPGGRAGVEFALTDRQGNPVPGALSLAAVDEAVFSVLDQAPGMEQTFYTLQQELLKPIHAVYPWSPTTPSRGRAEERQGFEHALFALTASQSGQRERDALLRSLLPFLENNPRALDVLQRPNWEDLVVPGRIPEDGLAFLRGMGGTYTFSATTFPANRRGTEEKQQSALEVLKRAWVLVAIVAIIGFLCIVALRFGSDLLAWLVAAAVLVIVGSLVLPAFQTVREASVRGQAVNDLQQLAVVMQTYRALSPKGLFIPPSRIRLATTYYSRLTTETVQGMVLLANDPPRVRDWFPETLLWRPQLITDDRGRARLDLDLADSITTWRLTASAVTADGRLGAAQSSLKVFQPFFIDVNLPVALTRGDEVAVPVVLYNYLDAPQKVQLKLAEAPWFERLDPAARELDLKPREVRATSYRLRVRRVGTHELQVTALGSGVADAVKRRVEVIPDGRRVEAVWNGNLARPAHVKLAVPRNAIEGSPRLLVKLYPSSFSQLVEGLDAIFRMPYGCFEQTSSTTYPNVLALDYLRRSGKSVPAVEAKARHYIHLGAQRLFGFEVEGGGFDWFGRPPANRTLTAYGLLEFQDMAKVHDVDPKLIERTRKWLLDRRKADGSWDPEGHVPHGLPGAALQGDALARLSTTAYIAWAVFSGATTFAEARPTRAFLLSHAPERIADPHALALVCNALLALDRGGRDALPYLERLDALKHTADTGRLVWWQQPDGARTTFHGSGRGGSVETTALAALALLQSRHNPAASSAALAWLVRQRDGSGTWHSTQATVLALKALLAGTEAPAGDGERRIELAWGDGRKQQIVIPADQAEVMKQLDLSAHLAAGAQTLTLTETTGTAAGYQVAFRYHEPGEQRQPDAPLSLQVAYGRDKVSVGEALAVTATVVNRAKEAAPMVMLDLPVPGGFAAVAEDFETLVREGKVAKFQVQPRGVLVYLREVPAGKALELRYGLRAVMPAQVTVPAARAYEYYDPDRQGFSGTARLTVTAR